MDVVLLVDALDGQYYLCCEKFGLFLLQDVSQDEKVHEISAAEVVHDQIEVVLVLEGVEQLDDPFSSVRQDVALGLEVSLLVLLYHFLLLEALDRHYPARLFLPAQPHLPEGAPTDHADGLEVFLADLLASLAQILHLVLDDILLGVFALIDGEVQLLDLLLKGAPMLAALLLPEPVEVVLLLNIALDLLGLLPGGLADGLICFHDYSVINGVIKMRSEVDGLVVLLGDGGFGLRVWLVGEEGEGDGGVAAAADGGGVDRAALEADARTRLCVIALEELILFFGGLRRPMVDQMAEGCYFLLDELLLQFGHLLPQFLNHQLISLGLLLPPHHALHIPLTGLLQFSDFYIFGGDLLEPEFYLTLEQPVLLHQLVLDALIVVELDGVLLAQSLVLILLVLHPHQTLLQLCDPASQNALLLLQDLHQLLVLLVLLRQQQEIFSPQLLPVPVCYRSLLHRQVHYIPICNMQYLKPELQGQDASVIHTLLDASREIAEFLRHSPVVVMESTNLFGDQQLHQDIKCDEIVEKHLRGNALVKAFASQERPHYQQIAEGEGFVVTYDPLDGSSIIDTNFAIGSIFSIWRTDPSNLVGKTLGDQVNAVITVYGPRTTALIYNSSRKIVQELTLIEKEWVISHEHLVIKPKSKMFSPGNLRAVNENEAYDKVVTGWIRKGYTLRYTGGLVPDVGQIFIKGHGVLSNIGSESHKCKLRALYEAAAVGFLVERAGGSSITTGRKSLMDFKITSFDDRLSFAVGSSEEIQALSHLF